MEILDLEVRNIYNRKHIMVNDGADVDFIKEALSVMYDSKNYIDEPGDFSATLSIRLNKNKFEYLYLHELSNHKDVLAISFLSDALFQVESLFGFFERLFDYCLQKGFRIKSETPRLGIVFDCSSSSAQTAELKNFAAAEFRKGLLRSVAFDKETAGSNPTSGVFVQHVPCDDNEIQEHLMDNAFACYFKLYDDDYLRLNNETAPKANVSNDGVKSCPPSNNKGYGSNRAYGRTLEKIFSIVFVIGVALVVLSAVMAFRNKDFAASYPGLYILAVVLLAAGGIYKLVKKLHKPH